MKKLAIFVITVALLLVTASGVQASTNWKSLAQKSVSGQFAVTALSVTSHHPKALAVRLSGHVQSGLVVVACSKDFSVSSNSRTYSHAGFFRLPMARGADSCDIVASIGGSGKVKVQILQR